jgi:hypothetical protein
VEHNGDLDNIISDIQVSGGTVIDKKINYDAETAVVDIEFNSLFAGKFRETDSFQFSNLSD